MNTTAGSHEIRTAGARRRQLRMVQLFFAGAAAIAMLSLFDAARPDTTGTMLGSGSVRLSDMAVGLPAPADGPMGLQFPQAPPNVSGGGGFAADADSDQAEQQAQQAEQQALQQMQQSMQQAEQQNEQAEQQFEQGMQQAQMDAQQANNP
jgi:hypothetical protein